MVAPTRGGAAPTRVGAVTSCDIEALIAVHDPRRPIERCVRSLEEGTSEDLRLRVTVVCHNIDAEEIRTTFRGPIPARTRFLSLRDGIRSPAGPFNAGLDAADATYITTIGSDDLLEPGALEAWWATAVRTGADAVLAPICTDDGIVATPLLRPSAPSPLDPVRDHLAERTAPLGLLRLDALRRLGFRYTEGGLGNGEDIEPALRLWFLARRLEYPYAAPAYRVTGDMGASRQTSLIGPLARELAFLRPLLGQQWLVSQPRAAQDAVLVKVLRRQVVSALRRRLVIDPGHEDAFDADDARFLATCLDDVLGLRGRLPRGLALSEYRLLAAAASGDLAAVRALEVHLRRPRLSKLVTARPQETFARSAPLRQQLRTVRLGRRDPMGRSPR